MGFDSALYVRELNDPVAYPNTVQVGGGALAISGQVRQEEQPLPGILMQLKHHPASAQPDTLPDQFTYARTDADGQFRFTGLTSNRGYSVVALKPGFEFGTRRGTSRLTSDQVFDFSARPHDLRLIGSTVYGQLKGDNALLVRTPDAFSWQFWLIVALFILVFWVVQIFWTIRRFHPDPLLFSILMLLSGLSVLTLLAIQDPLQDTLHAWQTLQGIGAGLVGMTIISQMNIGRLYADWRFDWLFAFYRRTSVRLSGWTWLVLAVGLAASDVVRRLGPRGKRCSGEPIVAGHFVSAQRNHQIPIAGVFCGIFCGQRTANPATPRLALAFQGELWCPGRIGSSHAALPAAGRHGPRSGRVLYIPAFLQHCPG